MSSVTINLSESFPHLPRAPIVEAVIEIRARAQTPWEEPAISACLKPKLPDYPAAHAQHEFREEVTVDQQGKTEHVHHDLGLKGLRFQSADKLHVVHFNRDGFVFSRLQPYDHWEQFSGEAIRLWQLHCELAKPCEIERLGLRFINRILIAAEEVRLEDYLKVSPQAPPGLDLAFAGFIHHDTLVVPGHEYGVNLIRTIQPQVPDGGGIGVILDIDVYTTQPFEFEAGLLKHRLAEMRWLKNKVFYGSITDKAVERFR